MKSVVAVSALALGIATCGAIQAHEGHKHANDKVVGTIVRVHHADTVSHIEVKTTKGDTVVLTADQTTKYLTGKASAMLADVKPGLRVIAKVTKEGEVTKASEIVLGAMDPEHAHKKPHPHDHKH